MMWSIEAYCAAQQQEQQHMSDWSVLPPSSRSFLERLGLPSRHPFCTRFQDDWQAYYHHDIPRQGLLNGTAVHDNIYDAVVTAYTAVGPPLLAMGELWLRLSASLLAPVGIVLLGTALLSSKGEDKDTDKKTTPHRRRYLSWIGILTTAASVLLLTDTQYALEFGPLVGASALALSTLLTGLVYQRFQLSRRTLMGVATLLVLAAVLVYDPACHEDHAASSSSSSSCWTFGDPNDVQTVHEGLYYDNANNNGNVLVKRIVQEQHWPAASYRYDRHTPWMLTGDARTGLPFLLHQVAVPSYTRVWLPVNGNDDNPDNQNSTDNNDDTEVVALDIAFPQTGHDASQPLYLVLHGLNGGSTEEYVRDFVWRQNAVNATVVIMVARGLMDLPVRGWHMFHGARWTDAHHAAVTIRQSALSPHQTFVAVGYSMGGIILSNMMVRAGRDVAVDAAVAVSGGLDMRQQQHYARAQRLWQPLLTKQLRQTFLLGKWGERLRARLPHDVLLRTLRATHITDIDASAVVHYNGFDNVVDYYQQMSALGDVPLDELLYGNQIGPHRRIQRLHRPLLVVHAMDDPLITWRTVASRVNGPMHPQNLTTRAGNGNLLLLLTRRGGHVGWPMGRWWPSSHKWYWMNHVAASFGQAVHRVMASSSSSSCENDHDDGTTSETAECAADGGGGGRNSVVR